MNTNQTTAFSHVLCHKARPAEAAISTAQYHPQRAACLHTGKLIFWQRIHIW